jgi:hypothetical protein
MLDRFDATAGRIEGTLQILTEAVEALAVIYALKSPLNIADSPHASEGRKALIAQAMEVLKTIREPLSD